MKTIKTLAELVETVKTSEVPLFIRYSYGPDVDREMGCSTNHATNRVECGLSVNNLIAFPGLYGDDMDDPRFAEWVARLACEYSYLMMGEESFPWLLTGEEIGRGADNEPLLDPETWEEVAYVALSVVDEALAVAR